MNTIVDDVNRKSENIPRACPRELLFLVTMGLMSAIPEDLISIQVFKLGGTQVYPLDLVIAICVGGALSGGYLAYARHLGGTSWIHFSLIAVVLLGVLLGLNQYGFRSVGEIRMFYPFIGLLLPLALLWPCIREPSQAQRVFVRTLAVCGFVSAIMFFVELINGGRFFISELNRSELSGLEDFRGVRILGTGQAFDLLMFASLLFFLGQTDQQKRIQYTFGTVILVVLAIITQNRTALFAWLLGVVILFWLRSGVLRFARTAVAIIVLALVAYAIVPEFFDRYLSAFASGLSPVEDDTGNWRILQLGAAFDQGLETPILGQSLGGYYYFEVPGMPVIDVVPHNQYILQFLKFGILGVVPVILLLVVEIRRGARAVRKSAPSSFENAVAKLYLVVMVSQIAYGMAYPFISQLGTYVALGSLGLFAAGDSRELSIHPLNAGGRELTPAPPSDK